MKTVVMAAALSNLATWCSPPKDHGPTGPVSSQNAALAVVGPEEPVLRARSLQGAASTEALEAAGDQTVVYQLNADGTATAYDYSEFGYDGSFGVALSTVTYSPEKLAEVRAYFGIEMNLLAYNDGQVAAELEAIADQDPGTHEYAGDVGTMSIAFADDGYQIKLFYRTDMYRPQTVASSVDTSAIDAVIASRKKILNLRNETLESGQGLIPQTVALAVAEQAQHAEFKGVFRGRDCTFVRDTGGVPPLPDQIVCRAYAEGASPDDGEAPLTLAVVDAQKLPNGPVTMSVPAAQ